MQSRTPPPPPPPPSSFSSISIFVFAMRLNDARQSNNFEWWNENEEKKKLVNLIVGCRAKTNWLNTVCVCEMRNWSWNWIFSPISKLQHSIDISSVRTQSHYHRAFIAVRLRRLGHTIWPIDFSHGMRLLFVPLFVGVIQSATKIPWHFTFAYGAVIGKHNPIHISSINIFHAFQSCHILGMKFRGFFF